MWLGCSGTAAGVVGTTGGVEMDMGDDTGVQVWFGPCYEVRLSSQLRYPGPEVFEFEGCDPWYGDASKVTLVPAEPKFEDNDFDVEGEML